MAVNRYYSNTAIATTLSGGINNSVTSLSVASVSGFPVSYPYTLVLDEGEATEELVKVTAAVGTTLTVVRGEDNTAAASHSAGATVKHVTSAQDFREPQEHIAATTSHGVSGALVGTSDTQTLTGKTIDLTDNTLVGTLAEFSAAVSDADLVGLATAQTLTSKTINLANNTLSGTLAEFNAAVSDADLVDLASTQTLTSKTINLASNTLVTTLAQLSAAVSDADVVGVASSQTLTNKTLTSPQVNGGTLTGVTINGASSISSSSAGGIGVSAGVTCEIILGYAGSGGLSIAQASPATHGNGVVLWVSGNSLYARHSNGADSLIS